MLKCFQRKVNCVTLKDWSHHRSGWNYLIRPIKELLHTNEGTVLYTNGVFDKINKGKIVKHDWIGICHFGFKEIQSIDFTKYSWVASLSCCKGIFVHSINIKQFLEKKIFTPIEFIWFGTLLPQKEFNFNKFSQTTRDIVSIGNWLRRHDRFIESKLNFNKCFLKCGNYEQLNGYAKCIEKLSNEEYDELLLSSIVFLDLEDSSCNNTLVECIVRRTPIIVTKLPAVVEYIGECYPLLFDTQNELEKFNIENVFEAYKYLKNIDIRIFSISNYFRSFYNSNIYKNLL